MSNERWYCLSIRFDHEFQIQKEIQRIGFIEHLPIEAIYTDIWRIEFDAEKNKGVKIRTTERSVSPLFTGYSFIKFDISTKWEKVLKVSGVGKILSYPDNKERPLPLKQGVVEHLILLGNAPDGAIDKKYRSPKKLINEEDKSIVGSDIFKGMSTEDVKDKKFLASILNGELEIELHNGELSWPK
jgi:transcription antitermination factor NusG